MLAVMARETQGSASLLDVGCGYGGLLQYAKDRGIELAYTGVEVVESMLAEAQVKHADATFLHGDVLELEGERRFDYVVCNGILTQKLDVPGLLMDDFAARLIRQLFALCRTGIAFNIMTTKVNFFSNNLYYRNPSELLAWCMSEISPHVKLDHSYPLFEYTVYLYRRPSAEL
jgi:SAM-dependent methyltransferase